MASVKINIMQCRQPGTAGPVFVVHPDGVWYSGLKAENVPEFIEQHVLGGKPVERFVLGDLKPVTAVPAHIVEAADCCAEKLTPEQQADGHWPRHARRTVVSTLQDFEADRIDGSGNLVPELRGKVVLAVNVASKCGLTPQYKGLEKLYEELGAEGLVVVGFPCNQFGGQEPGTEQEIVQFCQANYDVKFPLTRKIDVNGPGPPSRSTSGLPLSFPATSSGTSRSS